MSDVNVGNIIATLRAVDSMSSVFRAVAASAKQVGREAGENLQRVGEAWKKVGRDLSEAGIAITKLTAPLAAAAVGSLKLGTDFETSTTKLVTLSGVSETAMHGMRDSMLELGPAVGIGPRALSEALLVVTSTGIRGAEAMQILESSSRASAVGLGDTKDIAKAVTSAMTAYGKENLSAAKATEILFKTVREGGAEANELAGVLGRVVGIAAQVGVKFEEVGSFMATFTRLGVDSAEAVTALRGVLSTVLKPSKEARDQLEELHWSIDGLRTSIKEKGLTAALIELVERTKGNDDAIAAIVPNVRALAGVLGTAGAQAQAMSEVQRILMTDTDDMNAAFDRVKETAGFTFSQILARVEALAIKFGNELAPSLSRVLDAAEPVLGAAESMVKWFGDLPKPVQTGVIAFGALVTILGPFLFVLGQIITAVGTVMTALGGVPAVATAVGAAIAAIGWPISLTVAAVVGLGVVWVKWGDDIKRIVSETYQAVKTYLVDKFTSVVTAAKEKIQAVTGFFGEMYDKVVGHSFVPDMIEGIHSEFGRLDRSMVSPAKDAARMVTDIFHGLQRTTVTTFSDMVAQLQNTWSKLSASMKVTNSLNTGLGVASSFANPDTRLGGAIGGAKTGAKLGTMILPGWGTAIGAGVGALAGALKVPQAEKDARAAFAAFQSQFGSLGETIDAVGKAYSAMGYSGEKAQRDLARALDATHHSARDVEAALATINGVLDEQRQDAVDLDAAIKKYGFTIDELSPGDRLRELSSQAAQLMNEFRLLAGSGIDVGTVLGRMSGNISEFFQIALRTGSEIPAKMRPMLEQMVKAGQLLDENGQAFTDLDDKGISWSESMTQGFDRVVAKFDQLLAKIGLIPAALAGIPASIPNPFGGWSVPDMPRDIADLPVESMASGGSGYATGPRLFYTAGQEEYAFSGEGRRFSGGNAPGGRPQTFVAKVFLDARQIAEALTEVNV